MQYSRCADRNGHERKENVEAVMTDLIESFQQHTVSDLRSEAKGSRFESGCQLCAEVNSLQ